MSVSSSLFIDRRSDLSRRLADCLPGASFELEAFSQLIDIAESDEIPTAAVSTGVFSRLLVNPEFVATHCQRDEHLFLLVMHELWHVLLAHTKLHPRITLAQNIAFDAIINAGLCRQFPGDQFRGFFEGMNAVDSFPGRLLRPPKGWPHEVDYRGPGPRGTNQIMMRLYPWNDRRTVEPTYGELVALIEGSKEYKRLVGGRDDGPVLLGDHDGGDDEAMSDQYFGDAVRRVVSSWPEPSTDAFRGLGARRAGEVSSWFVEKDRTPATDRRRLEEVLRRACRPDRRGEASRSVTVDRAPIRTPIPSARDRRRVARRRLGIESVLWDSTIERRVVRTGSPASAKIYLDVSGSMSSFLPILLPPIRDFVRRRLATAWQFSTEVVALPLADLERGEVTSTFGTAVDCALLHALDDPRTRHIVLITDGAIDPVPSGLIGRLRDRSIIVDAVVPATCSTDDLEGFARVTRLVGR